MTPNSKSIEVPVPAQEPLTRGSCLALLRQGGVGRLAATRRAVPIVIPVCFTLVGEDIVFTAGPAEGLSRAVADAVVAFETDHVGSDGRLAWDVHVTGVARNVALSGKGSDFRLSTEIVVGWRASS